MSTLPASAPNPALIVISGGASPVQAPHAREPRTADPAVQRLLATLPAARNVLELGCAGEGELGHVYQRAHAGCRWTTLNPHTSALPSDAGIFDLVIINRLEHLPDPARTLADLPSLLAPGGRLFLLAENHACLSTMARLVEADPATGVAATAEDSLSLERAHPRFQSHSTIYKLLLDAGWTPDLVAHEPDQPASDDIAAAVRHMGQALGVPAGCVDRVHRMKHLIIQCQRLFDDTPPCTAAPLFDVVVPTTKEQQLRVNVEQSPGLKEVQARIISYRQAATPAHALEGSLPHVHSDWVLLCHQDVYFPKGFGHRLNALLATIAPEDRPKTLLGFIGMGVNRQTQQPEAAGFVVDRTHSANHPASDAAVSIDELALVIAKDSIHRIDPQIGWHLWATDLCLNAICTHRVFPHIVRLPLYHNSQSGWQLPAAFYDSADYILRKYPAFGTIHSLCGTINEAFVAQHRGAQR